MFINMYKENSFSVTGEIIYKNNMIYIITPIWEESRTY